MLKNTKALRTVEVSVKRMKMTNESHGSSRLTGSDDISL
jgi:hypothetical protein